MTILSGAAPSRFAPSAATNSALRATAARSADGDSHRTSASMSPSIACRRACTRGTMSSSGTSSHLWRGTHSEVQVLLAGAQLVKRHGSPGLRFGLADYEQVLGDRHHRILVGWFADH